MKQAVSMAQFFEHIQMEEVSEWKKIDRMALAKIFRVIYFSRNFIWYRDKYSAAILHVEFCREVFFFAISFCSEQFETNAGTK